MDQMHAILPKGTLVPLPAREGVEPISLDGKKTTIGRVPSNAIRLAHGGVSRAHAVIACEQGRYVLSDLGSRNGTFVNNKKVSRAVLQHGDKIMFGKHGFVFLIEREPGEVESLQLAEDFEGTVALSTEELEQTRILMHNAFTAAQNFFHSQKSDAEVPEDAGQVHERISGLYHLSENLRALKNTDEVLDEGLDFILRVLPTAQRTVIMLVSPKTGVLEARAIKYRNPDQANGNTPVSRRILDRVVSEQVAVVNRNIQEDPCFGKADSVVVHDIKSIICVPLINRRQVIGALHMDSSDTLHPFTRHDMEFAAAIANELALSLDNLSLQERLIRSEKMAAIGMTVTNLAHNIKNLLTIHLSSVDLLNAELNDKVDDGLLTSWRMVRGSLDRIAQLTSEMLAYAKATTDTGRMIDVNATIAAECNSLKPNLDQEKIRLELDLDGALPKWKLDEKQFRHAVLNLVVNAKDALKGVENGAIRISTGLEAGGRRLIVRVADNGCGIAEKDPGKVFELFYTTKGTSGNGIGLAMIKKFVESQGGDVAVVSRAGGGAEFSMVFPQTDA